jgi:hypothetical protein
MSKELSHNTQFTEVLELIASAKLRAVQAVNSTLVDLYWHVGAIISQKVEVAEWGDGVITQLAEYITKTHPNIRGFNRINLSRMRQFYETYRDHKFLSVAGDQEPTVLDESEKLSIVSPLVKQLEQTRKPLTIPALLRKLPWTHHMIIIGQSKRPEERESRVRKNFQGISIPQRENDSPSIVQSKSSPLPHTHLLLPIHSVNSLRACFKGTLSGFSSAS